MKDIDKYEDIKLKVFTSLLPKAVTEGYPSCDFNLDIGRLETIHKLSRDIAFSFLISKDDNHEKFDSEGYLDVMVCDVCGG